jgi:hypothetical protein
MKQFRLVPLVLAVAVWAGLLAGCQKAEGQTSAATVDLSTPESAIAAYVAGIKQQDLGAILAATTVEGKSKGYDFVAFVDRVRMLHPQHPAPASNPLFIEINKAGFVAQIANQIKFFTYGLMTTNDVVQGKGVEMVAAGATDFMSAVSASRLSGVELVKVGIPKPETMNKEVYQVTAAKLAKVYGADAATERVALISFEGLHFMIGFNLMRYGDAWGIDSQTSPLAGTNPLGAPTRTTPEEFEAVLK